MFLDPAPVFSLVPNFSSPFSPIPQVTPLAVAGAAGIDTLPNTTLKYAVPLVGTPAAGQPAALPAVTEAFDVPIFPTPTPEAGAPADLPTLTKAFSIPLPATPVKAAGAPADLPTLTAAFDVPLPATPTAEAGSATALPTLTEFRTIPTAPTPTAVAGVNDLDAVVGGSALTEAFDIPGGKKPLGITTDGTDFYLLLEASTADEIHKVSATGTAITAFGTNGVAKVTRNGEDKTLAAAITVLSGNVYVSESTWRGESGGGHSLLKFDATTGAESDITTGDNSCAQPNFRLFSGIHVDGTRLQGIVDWGGEIVKFTTDCTEVSANFLDNFASAKALALGTGSFSFFFTSEGEKIVKRNSSDGSTTGVSWTLTDKIIEGLVYSGAVLYLADADLKKVYKASIPHGQTVTTNPRGIAYDGVNLFILVDASPNDKILVIDPTSSTAPIIRSLDAPSGSTDAITYAQGFLYIAQDSGCCDREILKVDPNLGNVAATLTLDNPIFSELGGLGFNGTDLVGFPKQQFYTDFWTISRTDGAAETVSVNFDEGSDSGYHAATYRESTNRAYGALNNAIYEFTSTGEERQVLTLASGTDVEGMTFVGPNMFIVDDSTDKIYKGSIPTGITVTQDPLALAAKGTTTLYILVDATPKDKILVWDIATASTTATYDAPNDKGEGLTYLGTSLYYSSKVGFDSATIHELNPSTGAVIKTITPQRQFGFDFFDKLTALANDGTNVVVDTPQSFDPCLDVVNSTSGDHVKQLCDYDFNDGIEASRGLARDADGFYIAGKNADLVQLDPEGEESNSWSVTGATDIQGLAFSDSVLYIADKGTQKIYKTSVPSGIQVTTRPLALAVQGTTTMYVLVDATPVDKILVINLTSTTATSTDVANTLDAPDDGGEALTFLNGSLYYASNENFQTTIYKLNPSTGAELDSFNPQSQFGFDIGENVPGLGNDGTDLIISVQNPFEQCLHKISATNGNNEGLLCEFEFLKGISQARGVAVDPEGFIMAAKNDELVQFSSEGREVREYSNLKANGSDADIEGLAFVGTTLYFAHDAGASETSTVYKARVPSGIQITTNPLAVAYGTANGSTTTFILVDGVPLDKILLVDPDTGALRSSYDAPDNSGGGLTYLGTSVYYAGREENGSAAIYELNPSTGAEINSFVAGYQFGGESFSLPRGLANDGNELVLSLAGEFCYLRYDPSTGNNQGEICPDNFSQGVSNDQRGIAFASDGTLFSASGDELNQAVVSDSNAQEVLHWVVTPSLDIEGLMFIGGTIYVADDTANKIYKASQPTGITKKVQGLAHDENTGELFILVDGGRRDHIVVVDAVSGALLRDFAVPSRRAVGITVFDSSTTTLYVSAWRFDPNNFFNPYERFVYKLSPIDGSELQPRLDVFARPGVDMWTGLTNDGSSLILAPDRDEVLAVLDPGNGNVEKEIFLYNGPFVNGLGAIAFHESASDLLGVRGNLVSQFDDDGRFLQEFNTGLGTLKGAVVAGEVIYLADSDNDEIHASNIPRPAVIITTSPKGMATDGANLYLLARIHRRTACRRPAEETKGCASESGIMVLKQKTGPRKGAPDRCYHVTTPTASKSPSTTTAWWPMPG